MKNLKSGNVWDDDRSMKSERKAARKILMWRDRNTRLRWKICYLIIIFPFNHFFVCRLIVIVIMEQHRTSFFYILPISNIRCTFSTLFISDRFKKSLSLRCRGEWLWCEVKRWLETFPASLHAYSVSRIYHSVAYLESSQTRRRSVITFVSPRLWDY